MRQHLRAHPAHRALRGPGADHRRERHRQGAGRPGAPRQNSARQSGPFVKLNCAAVPHEPHRERALRPREGRLHRRGDACGGASSSWPTRARSSSTRWATCPRPCRPSCCACCRRASWSGWAAARPCKVDVRVIAATNKDLAAGDRGRPLPRGPLLPAQRGADLHLPPLRERREDLPPLVDVLPERGLPQQRPPAAALSPAALDVLGRLRLPGQRARAAQPGRAAGHPLRGPGRLRLRGRRDAAARKGTVPPPAPVDAAGASASAAPHPAPLAPVAPAPAPASGFRPRVDRAFREQVEDAEREIILTTLALHAGQRHRGGAAARSGARALLQEDEGAGHAAGRGKGIGIR